MNGEGLRAIDGLQLPVEYRDLLRPAEPRSDKQGNVYRGPGAMSRSFAHRGGRTGFCERERRLPFAGASLQRDKQSSSLGDGGNVYRIGDTYLDDEKSIAKYSAMADSLGTQVFVRPYEEGDDHLHFDIGFVMVTPRDLSQATP